MKTFRNHRFGLGRRLAITLLACGGIAPSQATIIGGPFVNPANGHTYYLLDPNTWQASVLEARPHACTLVQIADQAEHDWVYDTFDPLLTDPSSFLWMGLNDVVTEGTFVWSNGEPVTYTNWISGQPDNARGNENYGMIFGHTSGDPLVFRQWNDLANSVPGIFCYGVIETYTSTPPPPPPAPVPEPASLLALGIGALAVRRRPWGRSSRRRATPVS